MPERYTRNPLVSERHNCYDYSFDVVDPAQITVPNPRFHQPGGTKGLSSTLYRRGGRTCKNISYLMRRDVPELRRTTFGRRCPRGTSKIAMVADPDKDYHFYRQNRSGYWSHKDGQNDPKLYDANGAPIWDPRKAARDYRPNGARLNYSQFCGFYCAPRNKTIKLSRG